MRALGRGLGAGGQRVARVSLWCQKPAAVCNPGPRAETAACVRWAGRPGAAGDPAGESTAPSEPPRPRTPQTGSERGRVPMQRVKGQQTSEPPVNHLRKDSLWSIH